MKVSEEEVRRVASISRIELSEEEVKKFSEELSSILKAFSIMEKIDTKNVKPSFHPIELKERMREDKIEKSLSQEEALSNVRKNKENGYFKGPRVV